MPPAVFRSFLQRKGHDLDDAIERGTMGRITNQLDNDALVDLSHDRVDLTFGLIPRHRKNHLAELSIVH